MMLTSDLVSKIWRKPRRASCAGCLFRGGGKHAVSTVVVVAVFLSVALAVAWISPFKRAKMVNPQAPL